MSESCNHDCGSCSESCSERQSPQDFIKKPHELSRIKKVIGIVSGKGGVGKSLVCSLLACLSKRCGYNTAVLDADITGPSIPKLFGITQRAEGAEIGIFPAVTKSGIEVMSLNLLLEDDTQPVIWRGPVIAGAVEQFWTDVIWGDVDFMFIDMPPGTGDVPLTVFQSIPVDGIVIVASPQDLVKMIVEKAVNMANMMNIPILGIAENMSYIKCPDCGREIKLFGDSHVSEIALEYGIPLIGRIPVDPEIASMCDAGAIEDIKGDWLDSFTPILAELKSQVVEEEEKPFKLAAAYDNGKISEHFGQTKTFKIYTYTGAELTDEKIITADECGHAALANLLIGEGVEALICGGIGQEACDALSGVGIHVFGGVTGECDEVITAWLNGTLSYNPDASCSGHDNGGCGGGCGK